MYRESLIDYVLRFWVTLFMAIPGFWLGLAMILVTVLVFNWRPSITITQFWEDPRENFLMILGPSIAIGTSIAAIIARMTRTTVLEVLKEDYVRTARAKWIGDRMVIMRHVRKNAMLPVITLSGLALAGLLGGSVAVEKAFGFPGLGMALSGVLADQFRPKWWLVLFPGIIITLTILTFNLVGDALRDHLDPRLQGRLN